MNCKEAQRLVAGLNGDAIPEGLTTHVESCSACAALLAMDARLRATLRSPEPVPAASVLGRIRQEIATPARRSWVESLTRNPIMKITLPAAATLAVALAVLPHSATAATPRAAFAKMRKAVLAQAQHLTNIDIKEGRKPDGSLGTWILVDGELLQPDQDGTFHVNKDGTDIKIKALTSVNTVTDLSSLPPEQRAEVEKAIQEAMSGQGDGSHVHVVKKYVGPDGKEIDEATAQAALRAQGLKITTSIDLNENDYSTMAFGGDHDHLVLTPKKAKDRRTVVTLDPKTNLPKTVMIQRNEKGRWVALRQSNVIFR